MCHNRTLDLVLFSLLHGGNVAVLHDGSLQSESKVAYGGLILETSTSLQAGNIHPEGVYIVHHKHLVYPAADHVQQTRNPKACPSRLILLCQPVLAWTSAADPDLLVLFLLVKVAVVRSRHSLFLFSNFMFVRDLEG